MFICAEVYSILWLINIKFSYIVKINIDNKVIDRNGWPLDGIFMQNFLLFFRQRSRTYDLIVSYITPLSFMFICEETQHILANQHKILLHSAYKCWERGNRSKWLTLVWNAKFSSYFFCQWNKIYVVWFYYLSNLLLAFYFFSEEGIIHRTCTGLYQIITQPMILWSNGDQHLKSRKPHLNTKACVR